MTIFITMKVTFHIALSTVLDGLSQLRSLNKKWELQQNIAAQLVAE
jgi:hypothetical protein